MPVDAIPGDVEHAVLEPFDRNVAGREGGVLDLGERLHPADALSLFGPETVGVADRARIHFAVFGIIDPGARGPIGRYVVNFLGHFDPPPMRPVDASTASRLHLLKQVSPGLTAPTRRTNTTFGGAFVLRGINSQISVKRTAGIGALPGRFFGWRKV